MKTKVIMNKELVSVVIPVFNGEKYIEECVVSVLNQTYKNLEVIVVNDGSTDQTATLVNSIAVIDNRVKLIEIANGGRAKARNVGISSSLGIWVSFLDADDIWIDTKLEKQLNVAKEKNADFIYSERIWINECSEPIEQPKKYDLPSGLIFQSLIEGNYICTSTSLVKKNKLISAGGFNESATFKNVQDYDLWIRLSHDSIFLGLSDELCLYRLHDSNAHKDFKNRYIGLIGCIGTMENSISNYEPKHKAQLENRISIRKLSIANSFISSLFYAKAFRECLDAIKIVENAERLTVKRHIMKQLCRILSR